MSDKKRKGSGALLLIPVFVVGSVALIGYGIYRGDRVGAVITGVGSTGLAVGTAVTTAIIAIPLGLCYLGLLMWNR